MLKKVRNELKFFFHLYLFLEYFRVQTLMKRIRICLVLMKYNKGLVRTSMDDPPKS